MNNTKPEDINYSISLTPKQELSYEDGFADGYSRGWQECWEYMRDLIQNENNKELHKPKTDEGNG